MMIDQFLNYLRYERNASPQTVQTYEEGLREFESYISFRDNGLSLQAVDTDLIRDWMESLMDKGNSASTINLKYRTSVVVQSAGKTQIKLYRQLAVDG